MELTTQQEYADATIGTIVLEGDSPSHQKTGFSETQPWTAVDGTAEKFSDAEMAGTTRDVQ